MRSSFRRGKYFFLLYIAHHENMLESSDKLVIGTVACMVFFASVGLYGHVKKKYGLRLFGGAMAAIPPAILVAYIFGVAMSSPGANFNF